MPIDLLKTVLTYLLYPQSEYTTINTAVYAVETIVIAYLIFIFLKKMKIHIDKNLAVCVAPFIILGSSLRVLVDAKILQTELFAAPFSYISIAAVALIVLAFATFLQRKYKIPYFKTVANIGLLTVMIPLFIIVTKIVNLNVIFLVFAFILPWAIFLKIIKWKLENKLVSFIHILDATTTFVGVNYFGYYEMHVVPTFLMEILSPFSFILIKAFIISAILIVIDRYSEDKEFGNYLKLIIGILGSATLIRDFLRLLLLV